MNKILITFSIFLVGCAGSGVKTFVGPSGEVIADVACVTNKKGCFEKASEYCEGKPYQVNDSWSNAGGIWADWIPGPMTWYHMEISCGQSDGKMPSFAFRGERYEPPEVDYSPAEPTNPCYTRAGCNGSNNRNTYSQQNSANPVSRLNSCSLVRTDRGRTTGSLSLNKGSSVQGTSEPNLCTYNCTDGTTQQTTSRGSCPGRL